MTIIDWPENVFPVGSEDFQPIGTTISAGGVFGPGTVINVENRIWRVTADLGPLSGDDWRQVRAILDRAAGQFGVLRIPVIQEQPQAGALTARTFSRGVTFEGGAVFAAETLEGATVAKDAPVGATILHLSVMPSLVKMSAMFSLPGDKLHRVVGATPTALEIVPPLRRAVLAGDAVEFNSPKVRMRLGDDGVALRRVPANLTAPIAIPLVEAFT